MNVISVAVGQNHVLALKADGTVVGWFTSGGTYSSGSAATLPVGRVGLGEGLIQIQGRAVKLLDPIALKQLVSQRGP